MNRIYSQWTVKRFVTLGIATAVVLSAAATANAQTLPTGTWSTHYTVNGTTVPSQVTLNGSTGYYFFGGNKGTLYNIRALSSQANGTVPVQGNWSALGEQGSFTFYVNANYRQFNGNWNSVTTGRYGQWWGTRNTAVVQARPPAPAPAPTPQPVKRPPAYTPPAYTPPAFTQPLRPTYNPPLGSRPTGGSKGVAPAMRPDGTTIYVPINGGSRGNTPVMRRPYNPSYRPSYRPSYNGGSRGGVPVMLPNGRGGYRQGYIRRR